MEERETVASSSTSANRRNLLLNRLARTYRITYVSASAWVPRSPPISTALHHIQLRIPTGGSDLDSSAWLFVGPNSHLCDRYTLGRGLHRGPEHAVFEAYDSHREREVWLRLRPNPEWPDPRLRHPQCLRWIDQGQIGTWYIGVLDLEGSRPLHDDRLERRYDAREALTRWVELLTMVDGFHTSGRTHGQLSAETVRIAPDGRLRVLAPNAHSSFTDETDDLLACATLVRWLITGSHGPAGLPSDLDPNVRRCLEESLHSDVTRRPPSAPEQLVRLIQRCGHLLDSSMVDAAFPDDLSRVLREERATPIPILPTETWILPVETLAPAGERVQEPEASSVFATGLTAALLCVGSLFLAALALTAAAGVWSLSQPPDTPVVALGVSADVAPHAIGPHRTAPRRLGPRAEPVPVQFRYGKWEASPTQGFSSFVERAQQSREVHLTGHTDDRGGKATNYAVGLGRAWSVSLLMVARGMEEGRIEIHSAGETQPIASNETPGGRAANRRVDARLETPLTLGEILDGPDAP